MNRYRFGRFLLDIVYPNRCPFCDEVIAHDEYFCTDCPCGLDIFDNESTESETTAVFVYNEKSTPFIGEIKRGGNACAVSAAAKLICERLPRTDFDLITCIPAGKSRLRESGYNPPALIASEISGILGVKCCTRLLRKTRSTKNQKSLSKVERQANLKGAFEVSRRFRRHYEKSGFPARVLLIDDVCTTGTTLSEAAGVLLSAGAEEVATAVVAVVLLG